MIKRNQTLVTEFLLLGFGDLHEFKFALFTIFLIIHIMALTSNIVVFVLIAANQSLHSPMYFFISQLSLSEILFTSNIVPNTLWLILVGGGTVSIARCILQFYLLAVPTVTQCLLLSSMSLDRYVAICRPLHYTIIMTLGLQVRLVSSSWLVGILVSLVLYILLQRLEFCGLNTIDHFYCDIAPVVELSCSKELPVETVTSMFCFTLVVTPFMFIMASYIFILHTILKIPSTTGRHKAFSTCSSHLTVVGLYYGSLGSIYISPPSSGSININKSLALFYTLITPLVNPLIYSLRNQEIRNIIRKCVYM
ncbi:olfactory receptor 11L1-like [Gastrophryne carolinensis]